MKGRFHIAIATEKLTPMKEFFGGVLGCREGRSASTWVDYDLFGHQLTIQKVSKLRRAERMYNPNSKVPSEHFGVVLSWKDWHALRDQLQAKKVLFLLEPQLMFEGTSGEQMSMFIEDPDGRAIEFKAFEEEGGLFKK